MGTIASSISLLWPMDSALNTEQNTHHLDFRTPKSGESWCNEQHPQLFKPKFACSPSTSPRRYLNYIKFGRDWREPIAHAAETHASYYYCDPQNFNGTQAQKVEALHAYRNQ